MDDLQIVIYIVFIVLYILSRVLRKKKPVIGDDSQDADSQESTVTRNESTPRKKPVTFEELLRELEGQSVKETEAEEVTIQPEPEKEPEPEKTYQTYESAVVEPEVKSEWDKYSQEGGIRTLDEAVDINAPLEKRFDKYKISDKQNIHTASRYRRLLKSSYTVKDAIILKEILDRKHF